ncbi:MAG: SPOR domain-containing protein [Dinghuibacter sp.]|nr:SPOR domain-containing protein [Dinghuibacter sp.]
MKKILSLFVILGATTAQAQQAEPAKDSVPPPTIVVEKDPRIDVLSGKKIAAGDFSGKGGSTKVKQDKYGNVMMPGYRLQVLNSTDRNLVYKTKATLYQRFPGNGVYVVSQAPFFKLRFGNFATKEEADKYRKILSSMFPTGVYIVPDIIEARIKKPVTADKDKKKEKSDDN